MSPLLNHASPPPCVSTRTNALPLGSSVQGGGWKRALQTRASGMSRCWPDFFAAAKTPRNPRRPRAGEGA
eukprot:7041900-Pyramimonas_sp.AAC.1